MYFLHFNYFGQLKSSFHYFLTRDRHDWKRLWRIKFTIIYVNHLFLWLKQKLFFILSGVAHIRGFLSRLSCEHEPFPSTWHWVGSTRIKVGPTSPGSQLRPLHNSLAFLAKRFDVYSDTKKSQFPIPTNHNTPRLRRGKDQNIRGGRWRGGIRVSGDWHVL